MTLPNDRADNDKRRQPRDRRWEHVIVLPPNAQVQNPRKRGQAVRRMAEIVCGRKKLRQEERTEWEIERNQLNGKIDALFDQINKHRDEKAEVIKENTRLEVENTRLSMLKCEVINCIKRQPPTGY